MGLQILKHPFNFMEKEFPERRRVLPFPSQASAHLFSLHCASCRINQCEVKKIPCLFIRNGKNLPFVRKYFSQPAEGKKAFEPLVFRYLFLWLRDIAPQIIHCFI